MVGPYLEAKLSRILRNKDGIFVLYRIFHTVGPFSAEGGDEYYERTLVSEEVCQFPCGTPNDEVESSIRRKITEKKLLLSVGDSPKRPDLPEVVPHDRLR